MTFNLDDEPPTIDPVNPLSYFVTGEVVLKILDEYATAFDAKLAELDKRIDNVAGLAVQFPNAEYILRLRSYDLISKAEARKLLNIDSFLPPVDPPLVADRDLQEDLYKEQAPVDEEATDEREAS